MHYSSIYKTFWSDDDVAAIIQLAEAVQRFDAEHVDAGDHMPWHSALSFIVSESPFPLYIYPRPPHIVPAAGRTPWNK